MRLEARVSPSTDNTGLFCLVVERFVEVLTGRQLGCSRRLVRQKV
jgi:hypothetical protein